MQNSCCCVYRGFKNKKKNLPGCREMPRESDAIIPGCKTQMAALWEGKRAEIPGISWWTLHMLTTQGFSPLATCQKFPLWGSDASEHHACTVFQVDGSPGNGSRNTLNLSITLCILEHRVPAEGEDAAESTLNQTHTNKKGCRMWPSFGFPVEQQTPGHNSSTQ